MILDFNSFKLFEYNKNWNQEYFDNLQYFSQRIQYCEENLKRISSGSSRTAYLIEDINKVLKVAKNKKGLVQNETEIRLRDQVSSCAKIYDFAENNYWIEMEFANKLTPTKFKTITGFDFRTYCDFIINEMIDVKRLNIPKRKVDKKLSDTIYNNELYKDVMELLKNYNLDYSDFLRMNTYGEIDNEIVIVDFGIDKEGFDLYYRK